MKNPLIFLLTVCITCCVYADSAAPASQQKTSNSSNSETEQNQSAKDTEKASEMQQHSASKQSSTSKDAVTHKQQAGKLKTPLQKNESLQEVVNNLSDDDRKIVLEIQQEISTWPANLIEELNLYREFVLNARKEAEARYDNLSPQAKNALSIEKTLKAKLSPKAVEALSDAHL